MNLRASAILAAPLAAALAALFVGAYRVEPIHALAQFLAGEHSPQVSILVNVRLPRIVLAGIVGGSLACSGGALQSVFQNPLVDPFLLGISAGASLGCALTLVLLPWAPLPIVAFAVAMLVVFATWRLGRSGAGDFRLAVVLAGVVMSAFCDGLVSLIKALVDPLHLQSLIFWLMGSFSLADWRAVEVAGLGALVGLAPAMLMSWRLDMLSLGEEEAIGLGVNVSRLRLILVAGTTLAAAAAVSVCGVIGWVGLVVPNLVRRVCGPDHRILLPLSTALGAAAMIVADTLARSVASFEIPIGAITALAGVPFFIAIMRRRSDGASP